MLNSTVLGLLNEIVTEVRKTDPFRNNLLEIHVGLIHNALLSEFEKAKGFVFGMMYLCTFNGINIFINFNIKDTSYVPIFKDQSYEEQLPKEVIEIGGMRPTKNWLRKYGIK
jgi:hypothetical protein